jgi:hypothetical protein
MGRRVEGAKGRWGDRVGRRPGKRNVFIAENYT